MSHIQYEMNLIKLTFVKTYKIAKWVWTKEKEREENKIFIIEVNDSPAFN